MVASSMMALFSSSFNERCSPESSNAFNCVEIPFANPGVAINPVTGMPYTNVAGGIAGIQ
jgi:hypothetical protein